MRERDRRNADFGWTLVRQSNKSCVYCRLSGRRKHCQPKKGAGRFFKKPHGQSQKRLKPRKCQEQIHVSLGVEKLCDGHRSNTDIESMDSGGICQTVTLAREGVADLCSASAGEEDDRAGAS